MENKTELAGVIIAFVILFIFGPAFGALLGWLGGFLIELVLGAKPTEWLNLTFNTDRFAKGDLPKITAVLAIIGSYFKSSVSKNE